MASNTPQIDLTSAPPPDDTVVRNRALQSVSARLIIPLLGSFGGTLGVATYLSDTAFITTAVVIASGILGGFVGSHRRIRTLTTADLQLLADSWWYASMSPFIGGVLALLMYMTLLSGLLSGDLFPTFAADSDASATSFQALFNQHGTEFRDYAKLIIWCFLAGFSERFVSDILSRFEAAALAAAPP